MTIRATIAIENSFVTDLLIVGIIDSIIESVAEGIIEGFIERVIEWLPIF